MERLPNLCGLLLFYGKWKKNEGYERFHFHLNSFSSSSREQVQGVLSWIWQEYHHISLFIGETNGVLARKLWSYPSWDVRTPLLDFLIMGSTLTCPNSESTCLQVATDIYSIEYLGNLLPRANKHFWLSFLLRTKTLLEFSSTIDFYTPH